MYLLAELRNWAVCLGAFVVYVWHSRDDIAKVAPAATALVAFCALVVALCSLGNQKSIARKRAAIDFFLKTELDDKLLDAYAKYKKALLCLAKAESVEEFVTTDEYQAIET